MNDIHQLSNGRWIIAIWDNLHHQWQSQDYRPAFKKANPQVAYCFCRDLDGLARDCKTYKTKEAAMKARGYDQDSQAIHDAIDASIAKMAKAYS